MALHHCGTYSTDVYCSCFSQQNYYRDHFKQFNETSHTYLCCDQLNFSLVSLNDYNTAGGGTPVIPTSAYDFFNTINEKGITDCNFRDYFLNENGVIDNNYFANNYTDLFENYLLVVELYNTFIAGKNTPLISNTDHVTCPNNSFPYILEYKSPGQTYYNYSYICSQVSNDIFEVIDLSYGRADYNIKRFWNFSTNKPCIESSCQLNISNFGNIVNQGNQQPSYKNHIAEEKSGALASLIIASVILVIWIGYVTGKEVLKKDKPAY